MECGDRLTETDSSREKGGKTGAQAVCRMESGGRKLHIEATGDWSIANLDSVDRQLRALALDPGEIRSVVIDLEGITRFDTAAAFKRSGVEVGYENVSENQNRLFDKIDACGLPEPAHPPHVPLSVQFASKIGEAVRSIAEEVVGMAGFIGAVVKVAGRTIAHPRRFRMVPFVYHMEKAGFDALPLVCLLTFLIGAVVAQQGAAQLRTFGAEIFTVNLIAIIFLREVGLLLTAIIVAGRSGSAFTAEIGSMKMREEIDAMRTLGLDPMDMLVLPRVLALVVTLPLLTFIADIMGLIGGAFVVQVMLNMSPGVYIARVQEAAGFWTFGVGLVKAPFMAAMIGLVGCRAGLAVTGSAESVGAMTTRSVVRSIFLVIILDALFAIFFTSMGI